MFILDYAQCIVVSCRKIKLLSGEYPFHQPPMPVVELKFLENQTNDRQKDALTVRITKNIVDIMSCSPAVVTVLFNDIKQGSWGSAGRITEKPLYQPIVIIDILDGKTDKQKTVLIDAITTSICEIANCARENVVIIFHDISKDNWGSGGLPKSAMTPK